jgi:hypothetical protein
MKVVSERFISWPGPASGIAQAVGGVGKDGKLAASNGTEVKTSTCTNGKRRFVFDMEFVTTLRPTVQEMVDRYALVTTPKIAKDRRSEKLLAMNMDKH